MERNPKADAFEVYRQSENQAVVLLKAVRCDFLCR